MPGKTTGKTAKMPARQWSHTLTVIGLRFRWTAKDRASLAGKVERAGGVSGIRIEREPDNRADENALAVYLPLRMESGKQLGYLPREVAEVLAPKIDAGDVEIISAKLLDLDPYGPHPHNSGSMEVRFKDIAKS